MSLSRRHFLASSAAGTAVFGLGLSPAFAGTKAMPDWHLGYTSAPAGGFDPEPMRLVFGQVPKGLEGSLYRNGPAQFLYGKDDYARHWFDGDGMVQRIAIADGKAVHSGRFVQTTKRRIEQANGKIMAPGFGTVGHPDFPVSGPDDVNAANTSVIVIDGKLYALWEGGSAIAMDATTLETRGVKAWSDDLAGMPFLAHPKREPDGTVWNLAISGPAVGVYRIAADGGLQHELLLLDAAHRGRHLAGHGRRRGRTDSCQ